MINSKLALLKKICSGSVKKNIYFLFMVIFLILFLFSSCISTPKGILSQTISNTTSFKNSQTELINHSTKTPIRGTDTNESYTPTSTFDQKYNVGMTLEVTQMPVRIISTHKTDSTCLFKDETVTVSFFDKFNAIAYINLDNLADNSKTNSDVEIDRSIGNEISYTFSPINDSYYYFTKMNNVDYDFCISQFPIAGINFSDYSLQGVQLLSRGGSYCVLTNEGRIGTVKYITGSKMEFADGHEELSFLITVYKNQAN